MYANARPRLVAVILELVAGVYCTLKLAASFTSGVQCLSYEPALSVENSPFPQIGRFANCFFSCNVDKFSLDKNTTFDQYVYAVRHGGLKVLIERLFLSNSSKDAYI